MFLILVYGRKSMDSTCFFVLVVVVSIFSHQTEHQKIDESVTVMFGESTMLPCVLRDNKESLDQISWQRKTRQEALNDDFLTIQTEGPQFVNEPDPRFEFIGNFAVKDGTLSFSGVTLEDEGTYTCIFSLFPSGYQKKVVTLNVQVPPSTRLVPETPTLGDKEVTLATCIAAGAKPPVKVQWDTDSLGDQVKTANTTVLHSNATTTTTISLLGKPTLQIYRHMVRCVVTSEEPSILVKEILPYNIQVHYSPREENITKTNEGNTFACSAEANPAASTTWRRLDKPLPDSVKQEAATLQFLTMTDEVNGLYECETNNQYGGTRSYLLVHVSAPGGCSVYGTLFWLLLILNVIAAVAVFVFWRFRKTGTFPSVFSWKSRGQRVPTSFSPQDEDHHAERPL
ncbi:poliovirus receptor homolog isoform X2 [Cololabis saira]|uniref:poliovirus receptor homolog isoform X2 n=1 Tax=Cololabis saira TaxID=129043 RepID=UPI002AD510CA|nr:poliovirus receptor homolog isoform X2 [Cololabis saira]